MVKPFERPVPGTGRHIYKKVKRSWWTRLTCFSPWWSPQRKYDEVRDLEAERREHTQQMYMNMLQGLAQFPRSHVEGQPKPFKKPTPPAPRKEARERSSTDVVLSDSPWPYPRSSWDREEATSPTFQSGRGGDFGGAGASGSWEPACSSTEPDRSSATSASCSYSSSASSSDSSYSSSDSGSSSSSGD